MILFGVCMKPSVEKWKASHWRPANSHSMKLRVKVNTTNFAKWTVNALLFRPLQPFMTFVHWFAKTAVCFFLFSHAATASTANIHPVESASYCIVVISSDVSSEKWSSLCFRCNVPSVPIHSWVPRNQVACVGAGGGVQIWLNKEAGGVYKPRWEVFHGGLH